MKIYRYTFKYCLNYCFLSLLILVSIGLTYTAAFLASKMSEEVTLVEWFKLISSMAPYLTYFLLPYALIVGFVFAIDALRLKRYWLVLWSTGNRVSHYLAFLSRMLIFIIVLIVGSLDWFGYTQKPTVENEEVAHSIPDVIWLNHGDDYVLLRDVIDSHHVGRVEWLRFKSGILKTVNQWKDLYFSDGIWQLSPLVADDEQSVKQMINTASLLRWLKPDVISMMSIEPKYLSLAELSALIYQYDLNVAQIEAYYEAYYTRLLYPVHIFLALWVSWLLALSAGIHASVQRRLALPICLGVVMFIGLQSGIVMLFQWVPESNWIIGFYFAILCCFQGFAYRMDNSMNWL